MGGGGRQEMEGQRDKRMGGGEKGGGGREGVCVCDREGEPSVIMCTICT